MASMAIRPGPHSTSSRSHAQHSHAMTMAASNPDIDPTGSNGSVELQSLLPSNQIPTSLPGNTGNTSVSTSLVESVQVSAASNAPAAPEKYPQRYSHWERFQRYCHDSWVWELASMILSISSIVAIAVVLKTFE